MNFSEYKLEAARTCPDLGNILTNNIHMTMGMITEIQEMYEATDVINVYEEQGDFLWYFGNFCRMNNIDFGHKLTELPAYNENVTEIELFIATANLLDIFKKALAYNKPVVPETLNKICYEIGHSLLQAIAKINHIVVEKGGEARTLSDVLEANINKLRLRFPDKFDQDLAINRDHAAERVSLEKDLRTDEHIG
jgi:hypothetical protein